MRALILSDIHSNIVALEAVLRAAQKYDVVWCLGDIVGYGPAPNECVVRVRELESLVLSGNHDAAAVGRVPLEHFREDARRALEWTARTLEPENREWLALHQPIRSVPDHDLTLVHGSPREPIWEYILDGQIALENFREFHTSYCLFGHTHRPIAYQWRSTDRVLSVQSLSEKNEFQMRPKLLLNPGSVGQPRDGDPRAAFAIIDLENHTLRYMRVEYDIAATQRAITNAHLPYRLAARLAQGA